MHDNDNGLLLSDQRKLRRTARAEAANNRENGVPISKERDAGALNCCTEQAASPEEACPQAVDPQIPRTGSGRKGLLRSILLLYWRLGRSVAPSEASPRFELESPSSAHSTTILEIFELLCKIERLAQSLRRSWEKQLRKNMPNMSAARAVVLLQLGRSCGASQIHLARLLGFSQMTVSRVLDDLECLGWVKREPTPGDRRAWSVRLTDGGREVWLAVHAAHKTFVLRSLSAIDDEQWATFVATLARLEISQVRALDV
ncbi:MAG TPA: MarR family transcriptional regulator [Rhizomicrobium sp.]|jgi:DNA-binding MarR family transcriptional regulator|nr:MarR family transcriptional regulator [Rhizomicrobium sp.]